MKKVLSSLIVLTLALTLCADAATKATRQAKAQQKALIKKEKERVIFLVGKNQLDSRAIELYEKKSFANNDDVGSKGGD